MPRNPYWNAFYQQRYAADKRGIVFNLTFEDWLSIWQQSGRLAQRGKKSGQYVMARFNDTGAYSVGNVKIITFNENVSEGNRGKHKSPEHRAKLTANLVALGLARRGTKLPPRSAETCRRLSIALTGHSVSTATRQKISAANKGTKLTLETKRKLSLASKGKPKSVSHCLAISRGLKGKPKSKLGGCGV